jgi:hypothetical protein
MVVIPEVVAAGRHATGRVEQLLAEHGEALVRVGVGVHDGHLHLYEGGRLIKPHSILV